MVMENIININEYNDLINESNIIRNEIEEIFVKSLLIRL